MRRYLQLWTYTALCNTCPAILVRVQIQQFTQAFAGLGKYASGVLLLAVSQVVLVVVMLLGRPWQERRPLPLWQLPVVPG